MEEIIVTDAAPQPEKKEMTLSAEDKLLLVSTARWAKFISIVMFVCLGLALVFMLFAMIAIAVAGFSTYDLGMYGALMGPMYTAIMWPVMIYAVIMYLVQLLPAFYLYRFAAKAQQAIAAGNETAMTESFGNLRGSMKATGIIIIAYLAFLVLFTTAMVIAGWFSMAM